MKREFLHIDNKSDFSYIITVENSIVYLEYEIGNIRFNINMGSEFNAVKSNKTNDIYFNILDDSEVIQL